MSTYVAVFALLLAYVALVAAYVALRTLARLRRSTALLARAVRTEGGQSLQALADQSQTEPPAPEEEPKGALRNTALVRYDAFADLSGRMSFSLALLDELGNGVTLSAIAGSTDTRIYAKGVTAGNGEHELSPEERQAVAAALDSKRGLVHRKSA